MSHLRFALALAGLALAGLAPASRLVARTPGPGVRATTPGLASTDTLPIYGAWFVQPAPAYTEGSRPNVTFYFVDRLALAGIGFDSVTKKTGFYVDEVIHPSMSRPVALDSANVFNHNDPYPESVITVGDGYAFARLKTIREPTEPKRIKFSDDYLQYLSPANEPGGALTLQLIDTLRFVNPDSGANFYTLFHHVAQLRDSLGGQRSDISFLRELAIRGEEGSPEVSLLRYQWDSITNRISRASPPLRLPGVRSVNGSAFPLASYARNDSLWVFSPYSLAQQQGYSVQLFDLVTGHALPGATFAHDTELGLKESWKVDPARATLYRVNYYYSTNPQVLPELGVKAFDIRGPLPRQIWSKRLADDGDGFVSPLQLPAPVIDPAGSRVAVAYRIQRPVDGDWRNGKTEVARLIGLDAATGDSLWTTDFAVDSLTSESYFINPNQVIARPDGRGYIVTCHVSDSQLNRERNLLYQYAALFFVDTLGCLTPGCRDVSSVDPGHTSSRAAPYRIVLAPNPVAAGEPIALRLTDATDGGPSDPTRVPLTYRLTDISGAVLQTGRVGPGATSVSISTDGLTPGTYVLSAQGADTGAVLATKAFVVHRP